MITENEIAARAVIDDESKVDWTPDIAMVRVTFRACWYSALTVDQIINIGEAISGQKYCDVKKALMALVRAKTLRAYNKCGVRFYEINF